MTCTLSHKLSRCVALGLFVLLAAQVRPALLPFVLAALALGWWARGNSKTEGTAR